eukprot:437422_1
MSALNRIERFMKICTDRMVGHCIADDKFGKHHANGKVIDAALMLKNTNDGGNKLAGILEGPANGYPIYAEYLEPLMGEDLVLRDKKFDSLELDKYQTPQHCVLSSYHYQYYQCLHSNECDFCEKPKFDSPIKDVFHPVVIPPPIVVDDSDGLKLIDRETLHNKKYHFMPLLVQVSLNLKYPSDFSFDHYNLRYKLEELKLKICPFNDCRMQFPSKAKLQRHRRYHHFRQRAPQTDESTNTSNLDLNEWKDDNVVDIIGDSNGCYLLKYENGNTRWESYDSKYDELILKYKEQKQNSCEGDESDLFAYNKYIFDKYLLNDDNNANDCVDLDDFHIDKHNDERKIRKKKYSRKYLLIHEDNSDEEILESGILAMAKEPPIKKVKRKMYNNNNSMNKNNNESDSSSHECVKYNQ